MADTVPKTVDYRKMLVAYIKHVHACEGTDFLQWSPSGPIGGLAQEELDELDKLAEEAHA